VDAQLEIAILRKGSEGEVSGEGAGAGIAVELMGQGDVFPKSNVTNAIEILNFVVLTPTGLRPVPSGGGLVLPLRFQVSSSGTSGRLQGISNRKRGKAVMYFQPELECEWSLGD